MKLNSYIRVLLAKKKVKDLFKKFKYYRKLYFTYCATKLDEGFRKKLTGSYSKDFTDEDMVKLDAKMEEISKIYVKIDKNLDRYTRILK